MFPIHDIPITCSEMNILLISGLCFTNVNEIGLQISLQIVLFKCKISNYKISLDIRVFCLSNFNFTSFSHIKFRHQSLWILFIYLFCCCLIWDSYLFYYLSWVICRKNGFRLLENITDLRICFKVFVEIIIKY